MKKLFLVAAAACLVQTTACAQKSANAKSTSDASANAPAPNAADDGNCKTIQDIMAMLETANMDLKSYRGEVIQADSFRSKATLTGFAQHFIVDESSVILFLARTAPIPKKEAAMAAYKDLLKQINACIDTKKYPGMETKSSFRTETSFSPRMGEGEAMVSVAVPEPYESGEPYVVELMIVKNKPMK